RRERAEGRDGFAIASATRAGLGAPGVPLALGGQVPQRRMVGVPTVDAGVEASEPTGAAASAPQPALPLQPAQLDQRRPGGAGWTVAGRPGRVGEQWDSLATKRLQER